MIEKMFPQTVSNIIDYDAIKAAAKKYVEDVFVEIVKSFGDNLILQTMDEAHLAEVSKHVAGDSGLSVEDLLSYMNTDNIYRESQFVSDLLTAFPSGVEYLEFEVTGWKFPQVDFAPFSEPERSYNYDGTQASGDNDEIWMENAFNGDYVNNLLLSRYKGQFDQNMEFDWHKKSGRRSSWGDAETWMTTGGFGKPASIHINVGEERTVLEENGLSSVENWLGTVADKLPINLYIEINDVFKTNGEDTAGSTNGYRQSFPYAEGEGFCTNDPAMAVSPNAATVTYTISYANTQLPNVQIELPESETVEDGYSIILPTMTGEYESGGKTWTPTAWDIGAFGDSYTPNANTVAHLLFEEVETYQEITLYMQSGNKQAQGGVTSSYTGTVNSSYCYQLYTDEACTIPWKEYDYSNDYELGRYVDGVWTPLIRQTVAEMPDFTTGNYDYVFGRILMDTGQLWHVTNYQLTGTTSNVTLIVRIYPKVQQQYPLYFSQNSNAYDNYSTSGGMVYMMKHRPGNLSYGWMPWSDSFPTRTIVKALYSSGKSNIAIDRLSWNGTDNISIQLASGYSPSFRNVIFTLDVPTYTSWANLSGNKSAEPNEVCPLFDKNGEYALYDPTMSYTIIGLFNYSGGHPFNSPNRFMLNAQLGAFDTDNPTRLCFKLNRAVTFSSVWYIKTPIP